MLFKAVFMIATPYVLGLALLFNAPSSFADEVSYTHSLSSELNGQSVDGFTAGLKFDGNISLIASYTSLSNDYRSGSYDSVDHIDTMNVHDDSMTDISIGLGKPFNTDIGTFTPSLHYTYTSIDLDKDVYEVDYLDPKGTVGNSWTIDEYTDNQSVSSNSYGLGFSYNHKIEDFSFGVFGMYGDKKVIQGEVNYHIEMVSVGLSYKQTTLDDFEITEAGTILKLNF